MLVFLTSIRHPQNSNDYRKVEELLQRTLMSVCSQIDPNFRVVVVCNAEPRIEYQDPRVIYHVVDYPPPSPVRGASTGINALVRDKGTKLLSGMLLARQFNPTYFGIFDADDLVSRRIAGFVNSRPGTGGWYVDSGYTIDYGTWRVQRKHGLVRYCGTSLIPNATKLLQLSGVDNALHENVKQDELLRKVGAYFIDHVIGNHPYMKQFMAKHGVQMRPVPFRAVAWVTGTGENHTMTSSMSCGLPVSQRFAREFGVVNLPPSNHPASATDYLGEMFRTTLSRLGSIRDRILGLPALPRS